MNEGEMLNCDFQSGLMDKYSFYGLIIMATYKADRSNIERMRLAFPELTESIVRWKTETGYAKKLMKEYMREKGGE